jgi:hypothetical protein
MLNNQTKVYATKKHMLSLFIVIISSTLFDATQIIEARILMVAKWLLPSEGHLDLNMFPGFIFCRIKNKVLKAMHMNHSFSLNLLFSQ